MKVEMTLYVTGMSHLSIIAIKNLKNVYKKAGMSSDFKIIDILKHPEIAEEKNILATPLLEKTHPTPTVRIIGDLSDVQNVLAKLKIVDMKVMPK